MSQALERIRKVEVKLELTPMIDVTFLLLIFFMVTAKFKKNEGSIQAFLPKDRGLGTSSPKAVTETRVKLLWYDVNSDDPTKDKHGRCVLKVGKIRFKQTVYTDDACYDPQCKVNHGSPDFEQLREYLRVQKGSWNAERGDEKKGMPVIIDARPQVPFRFIVRALNASLEAGLKDITFAAAENPF